MRTGNLYYAHPFLTTDVTDLSEAEREMLALINRNKSTGTRTTVKALIEYFEKKPYGWYYAAILCILAKLIARGKTELREDSNLLEESRVIDTAIRNTTRQGNIIIELCETVSEDQLRKAKQFYKDMFDTPTSANEVKTIGQDIQQAFGALQRTLDEVIAQQHFYPFASALKPYSDEIRGMAEKPYVWFVISMVDQRAHWLEAKEQLIDPIRRFMGSMQKTIFDRAREFISANQANINYLDADVMVDAQTILNDPECFKGGKIQQLKIQMEKLQEQLERILADEKKATRIMAQRKLDQLCKAEGSMEVKENDQAELRRPFEQALQQMENQTVIAVIRDLANRVEGDLWTRALNRLAELRPSPGPEQPPHRWS